MRRIRLASTLRARLLAVATLVFLAITSNFALAQSPSAPKPVDFGGIWDLKTTQNAQYSLRIHMNSDNTATGEFMPLGGDPAMKGTLTGSISEDGSLAIDWMQPNYRDAHASGALKIYGDGTLGGGMTVTEQGAAPYYTRWYGTRRSRQVSRLGVKHTAPEAPGGQGSAALENAVVKFARDHVGSCVNSVFGSDCECTRLVEAALAYAGAWTGSNFVWGDVVSDIRPGDIIQFWDTHFVGPNLTWGVGSASGSHHTAIVETVSGARVMLIHQNDGERITHRGIIGGRELDLGWQHSGRFTVYRPKSA